MKPAWNTELVRISRARDEILRTTVVEEKPRELCKIARLYSRGGMPDRAKETLRTALKVLEDVKEKNPWKFTNHLCNVAYEMACLGEDRKIVRKLLERAIISVSDVDAYYTKRKKEVLSLLKRLSGDKRIWPHLMFKLESGIPADSRSGIPFEQTFDFLYSYIFLSQGEIKSLKSLVEKDAGTPEILRAIANIDERWRQTVALATLSRLFLRDSKVKKAREILHVASRKTQEIEFYWARDNALEVISGTFLEVYSRNKGSAVPDGAKNSISLMKDPWKKARALCRIAGTHIREERFEQAAQEINYVHSHLLDRIDYRDRTAMSMLLIVEVFDKMNENRANNLLSIFNPDRRRANTLRRDAFSILDSFDHRKRKESLEEYEGFISLKGKS